MNRYSLGFVFTPDFKKVLLMLKSKPEFQRGKLNGLGGKIETGETSLDCIIREIREESGLDITKEQWVFVGTTGNDTWTMDTFGALYHGAPEDAQSLEKEEIGWFDVGMLPDNKLENLDWLMHITIDKMKYDTFEKFTVEYKKYIDFNY